MGDANALNSLGYIYKVGKGVDQDYKKAFESFKKAADMGDEPTAFSKYLWAFS